jgi:hypothetical protein
MGGARLLDQFWDFNYYESVSLLMFWNKKSWLCLCFETKKDDLTLCFGTN